MNERKGDHGAERAIQLARQEHGRAARDKRPFHHFMLLNITLL
jgi:hypothetical protein